MRDLQKLVGGLSKTGALSGFLGGVAGGGLTSMVASKKGRKVGGKVVKYGALAAVGGLAWKAYQQYSQNQQQGQPSPTSQAHPHHANQRDIPDPGTYSTSGRLSSDTYTPDPRRRGVNQPDHRQQSPAQQFDFTPARLNQQSFDEVVEDNESGQMLLMRAMIAAAYADGHIDESERQRIFEQVDQLDLSVNEKALLFDELRKPLNLAELINQVPDAQSGIEVYAASASAIDLQQPASAEYLDALANQLCLPNELVSNIHQQLQST
ncbi:tellurite resistance TerB family protein [Alteromonas oceanisediminis]|uniref:tellurite resistance TerB family protein n=1 Tax=Alteromonas oceanisediminis TaxID=2836180 RepID=UPI001BDAF03D|nr:tellurite resistance TerB family protein [Alteromonas oceanisediminis]MBT0587640.1 DUF533 domain-containing protein [Alteromonas oceanisediminis]